MKTVVSLSRRTEPYFYAEKLAGVLTGRYPPERVHTVVIWTKFPETVLVRLRRVLAGYAQVYVHLTITGLGGTAVEPCVPPPEKVLAQIPALIEFLRDPRRLRVRPDPLVVLQRKREVVSNLVTAGAVIREAASCGVKTFSSSFVALYPKVRQRLARLGWEVVVPAAAERQRVWEELARTAAANGATLYACCVPGLPVSRCIDGALLTALHPAGERCRLDKAQGQRAECGCTHSVDLCWYTMPCPSGCLYCYANARITSCGDRRL
ncbi:uncharacterized protein DUF1848 [Thermodesulfitimonas autotrophica]|uniref:Uncharacterized protein DUF1848 n=1 Tax=Thermodesulfitimonas autotrophica TaxID=1894989 RepID=A0A3N5B1K1_9THEO|nr:DUF1848 family protein [Thermodesulfitimonas autotrophica]RPF42692.1 uncharacterized protein DUF1848 [Thermodesulfitimonas autotrophica]